MKNPLLDVRFGAPEAEITAPKKNLIPYPNILRVEDSRENQIRFCQQRIIDSSSRFRTQAMSLGGKFADAYSHFLRDSVETFLFQYFIAKYFHRRWREMLSDVYAAKYPADIQPAITNLVRDEGDHIHGITPQYIIEAIQEKVKGHPLLQEKESVKQLKAQIARLTDDTKKQMLGYIGEETVIKPLSWVKLMPTQVHEPSEIVRLAIKSSHDDLIISEFMKGCTSLIRVNPVSAFADPGGLLPRSNIAHPGEQISLSLKNNSPDKEARVTAWVCYKPVFLNKGYDPHSAMSYENLVRTKAIIGR